VVVACAVVCCIAYGGQKWHGISESAGEAAIRRVPQLRVGMPEEEVFKALGLSGYGLTAWSSGSGPRYAWPTWYLVTEKRAIVLRWNLTKKPPILVSSEVFPFNRRIYRSRG
jgi:hypothetical protein